MNNDDKNTSTKEGSCDCIATISTLIYKAITNKLNSHQNKESA